MDSTKYFAQSHKQSYILVFIGITSKTYNASTLAQIDIVNWALHMLIEERERGARGGGLATTAV